MDEFRLEDDGVVIDLREHCIETGARRAHERLTATALEADPIAPELAAALELLADFLGAFDFRALRAADPALAGGQSCRVRLRRDGAGRPAFDKISR